MSVVRVTGSGVSWGYRLKRCRLCVRDFTSHFTCEFLWVEAGTRRYLSCVQVLGELGKRGVLQLMVEGGGKVLGCFLSQARHLGTLVLLWVDYSRAGRILWGCNGVIY